MVTDIRKPNIVGKTDSEKIEEIRKYLFELTDQLNYIFSGIDEKEGEQKNGLQS